MRQVKAENDNGQEEDEDNVRNRKQHKRCEGSAILIERNELMEMILQDPQPRNTEQKKQEKEGERGRERQRTREQAHTLYQQQTFPIEE